MIRRRTYVWSNSYKILISYYIDQERLANNSRVIALLLKIGMMSVIIGCLIPNAPKCPSEPNDRREFCTPLRLDDSLVIHPTSFNMARTRMRLKLVRQENNSIELNYGQQEFLSPQLDGIKSRSRDRNKPLYYGLDPIIGFDIL